jgi:hypothetical protein
MPDDSPLVTFADTLSAVMYAVGSLLAVGLGVVAGGAGIAAALAGDTVPGVALLGFGVAFTLLGAAATAEGRRRLARRRDPTAFGRRPTVASYVRRPEHADPEGCTRCGASTDEGLLRRYREETLLAGVPIYTHETGENVYCLDCATAEFVGPTGAGSADPTEPDTDALDALAGRGVEPAGNDAGAGDHDADAAGREPERSETDR